MNTWKTEIIDELNGYSLEWTDSERFIISKKNQLFLTDRSFRKKDFFGEVPVSKLKEMVSSMRLGQRFSRLMFYNVIPLSNGSYFVNLNRTIGVIQDKSFHLISGVNPRGKILRQGAAVAEDDRVYWGEYTLNNERHDEISIYRYTPEDSKAEIVHAFNSGEIRHVHGIYRDFTSTHQSLWCLTGDSPNECKFMKSNNGFLEHEVIWGNDESWRAVSALFTKDSIFYASDAEFEQNYIYKIDKATGKRKTIVEIDGPCYYSMQTSKALFFAVTAELCPSQKSNKASLWQVDPVSGETKCIFTAHKDFTQDHKTYLKCPVLARLFMFGTLNFPCGRSESDETYVSVVGLKKYDNKVIRLYAS